MHIWFDFEVTFFSVIVFASYVVTVISLSLIFLITIFVFTFHLISILKHLTINKSTLYLVLLHYWD